MPDGKTKGKMTRKKFKNTQLAETKLGPKNFLDRESSWMEFNVRVLNEALDSRTPLLERLRFANIYVNFANHIRAKQERRKLAKDDPALDYPKIQDGIRGMAFIEAVVKSSKNNARWTKLAK